MMEFTHFLHAAPPDVRDETWWRCPYCGHDGMTKESTLHLPRCPWPQLEADRLEIERLRAIVDQMKGPTMDDDDELITAEWWYQERLAGRLVSRGGEWYLGRDDDGVYICNENGDPYALPAVRTRGDVRALVRLLGRE